MNKSIFLLLLLMMSSLIMYSQSETKRDSLANRLTPLKEISKEPIIYQEPLINSMDTELDGNESYDNVKSELPNYLNYKLKLTPDLRPRKLSSTLSYSLPTLTVYFCKRMIIRGI